MCIIVQAGEMQSEKARFEETVGVMSEQLMDFVDKMNKLERECVSQTQTVLMTCHLPDIC